MARKIPDLAAAALAARYTREADSDEKISKLKHETRDMLVAYRKANGLGCLNPIARMSGVPLSCIYDMLDAAPVTPDIWFAVRAALDICWKNSATA